MNRSKILAAVVAPLSAFVIASAAVNPDPRLQIILDVSGSMRGQAGGQEKIAAAKEAILATIDALEEGSLVPGSSERPYFLTALRFYGHRLAPEPKTASCDDTELVIPFQPLERSRFVTALDAAVPRGQTPLSTSLKQAAADFGEIGEDPAVIILVSDREETCGGDPVATACELKSQGFDITMHTVGFDVGADAKRELEGIAECTGGEYRDAGDAEQLGETLKELTAVSFVIDKQSARGEPIRGGDAHDDAVPLEPGTLYHLDHHQREDEFDYFYIDVTSGQKIIATADSHEVGISIRGDQAKELEGTSSSCAGIAVDAPDGREIAYDYEIMPRDRSAVEVPLAAGNEGRYYVRVGPRICNQHMNSTFRIELIDLSDTDTGMDAGSQQNEAVEILPGREYTGHLHRNDRADMFRFRATADAPFSIRARPTEQKTLELQVLDGDGVVLAEREAPNEGAAVRIDSVAAPRDGDMFVRVANGSTLTRNVNLESPYSLEVAGPVAATEDAAEEPVEETTGESDRSKSATDEDETADDQPADQDATAAAEGGGGISPVLILLALLVIGAALAGGVVLGRRTR